MGRGNLGAGLGVTYGLAGRSIFIPFWICPQPINRQCFSTRLQGGRQRKWQHVSTPLTAGVVHQSSCVKLRR
eukprot:10969-Pelagomonas_calceolata.AAC.1